MSEPKHTNALIHEKSPYLLQHAHNPVDWLPWGEEAFARAKKEDKPILLSVGYSTCHWCHVMEHESFENEEVAKVLNECFVNIKVDREERPDVDLMYMTYVQAMNGSGGWPMNVWLTPDLKPFFGATYIPPEDKGGRMGLKRLSGEIARVWKEDRANLLEKSSKGIEALQRHLNDEMQAHDASYDEVMKKAYDDISGAFDYHEGGFGSAPKFPRPVTLALLWRLKTHLRGVNDHDSNWCEGMAKTTLSKMWQGGMWDHLGGGFHRYSVDAYWHVPHYEKMLYDQAQLTVAYLEGYQNTGMESYADIARKIIEYAARDLRHPEGAFFSAEDADSFATADSKKKTEGAFYVWRAEEIDEVLGKNQGNIFRYAYGATRNGNARPESDPHGELQGLNTLFRAFSPKKTAEFFKLPEEQVTKILDDGRKKLFEARCKRPRPHLDDKVIVSWNGLMISALAKAASVLGNPDYLKMADSAAQFLHDKLCETPGKGLRRSWRESVSNVPAFATDYAMVIQGLIDLYQAGFEVKWLRWAVQLQDEMDATYLDKEKGGYFSTRVENPNSILSVKEDYDSAEPSPNSVAGLNLLRLASMLGREEWHAQAEKLLKLFGSSLEKSPFSVPAMVTAFDFLNKGDMDVVLAGQASDASFAALAKETRHRFLPHAVLLHADGGEGQKFLAEKNDSVGAMSPVNGQASAYVCNNHTCKAPVTSPEALAKLLEE